MHWARRCFRPASKLVKLDRKINLSKLYYSKIILLLLLCHLRLPLLKSWFHNLFCQSQSYRDTARAYGGGKFVEPIWWILSGEQALFASEWCQWLIYEIMCRHVNCKSTQETASRARGMSRTKIAAIAQLLESWLYLGAGRSASSTVALCTRTVCPSKWRYIPARASLPGIGLWPVSLVDSLWLN